MNFSRYIPVLVVASTLGGSTGIKADGDGTIINLFSTGLTNANTFLAEGSVDSHWTLTSSPIGGNPTQLFVAVTDGYPLNSFWIPNGANGANAQWLMPTSGLENDHPVGAYVMQTSFDYVGPLVENAFISFRMSSDNHVTDVLLNGHSLGISWDSYTALSNQFTIDEDFFLNGVNSLQFLVLNDPVSGPNPTGLFVDFTNFGTVTATQLPEPSTMGLVGAAAGVGILLRRRRRT